MHSRPALLTVDRHVPTAPESGRDLKMGMKSDHHLVLSPNPLVVHPGRGVVNNNLSSRKFLMRLERLVGGCTTQMQEKRIAKDDLIGARISRD